MIECIGIQKRKGSFEDDKGRTVEYDNVMIYFVTNDNNEIQGFYGKELKVNTKQVEKINFQEWEQIIGKVIDFHYNMFGTAPKLDGIKIVGDGQIHDFLRSID